MGQLVYFQVLVSSNPDSCPMDFYIILANQQIYGRIHRFTKFWCKQAASPGLNAWEGDHETHEYGGITKTRTFKHDDDGDVKIDWRAKAMKKCQESTKKKYGLIYFYETI
jgi:hypothetical protein